MIVFRLHANCLPVMGVRGSIIMDLQLGRILTIPIELCALFEQNNYLDYSNDTDAIVKEYLDYLILGNYGALIEKNVVSCFTELNLEFKHPSVISNCIIDIDDNSNYELDKINSSLINLGCKHIQLRFFIKDMTEDVYKNIDVFTTKGSTFSVDLVICSNQYFTKKRVLEIPNKYINITTVSAYGYDTTEKIQVSGCTVSFFQHKIYNHHCCGIIKKENFAVNIQSVSESRSYNSCLNQKIGIDVNGNIKNCPSSTKSYGNVCEIRLEDVITDEFRKLWYLKKDDINICRNCEFRYVCTDCRMYLEDPDDIKSKPLKCGYDPYTCTWSEWSNNPLKEKTIKYYGISLNL